MKRVLFFLSVLLLAYNPVYAETKTSKVITNYDEFKNAFNQVVRDYEYDTLHTTMELAEPRYIADFIKMIIDNKLARVTHVLIDRVADNPKNAPSVESMFVVDNISDVLEDILRKYGKSRSDEGYITLNSKLINKNNFKLIIADNIYKYKKNILTRSLTISPKNTIIVMPKKATKLNPNQEPPKVLQSLQGGKINGLLATIRKFAYEVYDGVTDFNQDKTLQNKYKELVSKLQPDIDAFNNGNIETFNNIKTILLEQLGKDAGRDMVTRCFNNLSAIFPFTNPKNNIYTVED
ncbi:MAG: hypothetical protein K2N67_03010, partial [Mucispirillum sp.]|nr:hypothetical protein [Mucispirillum sp.]